MLLDDALKALEKPPSFEDLFKRIAPAYMAIISLKPVQKQVVRLDELQSYLPQVLLLNAARDVGNAVGLDIRNKADYDTLFRDKKDLIATRMREINRFMTEGWVTVGGMARKIVIGGLRGKQKADFEIFQSTYIKALVTKDNAMHYLNDDRPIVLTDDMQVIEVPIHVAELFKTAAEPGRGPQPGK